MSPRTLYADGGPWIVPLAIVGVLGIVCAALAPLLLGARPRRFPTAVAWSGPCGVAGLGLVAVWMAYRSVFGAMDLVPVDARAQTDATLAVVFASLTWQVLASAGLLAFALVAWLPSLLRSAPDAYPDTPALLRALGAAGLAFVVALTAVQPTVGVVRIPDVGPAAWLLPPLAVATTLVVCLASLRTSDDPGHRSRLAVVRLSTGVAGFLALGLLGEGFTTAGVGLAVQAVMNTSTEVSRRLLANGVQTAAIARALGWALALGPLFAGIGAASPCARSLLHPQRTDLRLSCLQAIFLIGCAAACATMTRGVVQAF